MLGITLLFVFELLEFRVLAWVGVEGEVAFDPPAVLFIEAD